MGLPSLSDELERVEGRVLGRLKPFQRASVDQVMKLFEGGSNRVLVADEVGLGKTLIARGVIASTARLRHDKEGDPFFKVVYICSNGAIINQNLEKLSVDDRQGGGNLVQQLKSGESRLSMQHLLSFEKQKEAETDGRYIQLIPLTPGTSFNVTSGCGIVQERALMYEVLRRHGLFQGYRDQLKRLLQERVGDASWDWWTSESWPGASRDVQTYCQRVDAAGEEYLYGKGGNGILGKIDGYRGMLEEDLMPILDAGGTTDRPAEAIGRLRRMFSEISVSGLDPDLVIMDEFQRFRGLLDEDADSEMGMLTKRFLQGDGRDGDPVRVLLLSATPFKPYSTAAEDETFFGDESREDFLRVVEFLANDQGRKEDFASSWEVYGRELASVKDSGGPITEGLLAAKSLAEEELRNLVSRTERVCLDEYRDIVRADGPLIAFVDPVKGDIASYLKGRRLFSRLGIQQSFSPEYTESCPYLLSFLKGYKLGEKLASAVERKQGSFQYTRSDGDVAKLLWVSKEDVNNYRELSIPNSRFLRFQEDVFETGNGDFDASALLWVPASLPYYEVDGGPYKGAEGFTKTLVFSSWTMVPRMMASLLSYEDERRSIRARYGARSIPFYYADKMNAADAEEASAAKEAKRSLPSGRLIFQPGKKGAVHLLYPSIALARIADWSSIGFGLDLGDLRRRVGDRVRSALDGSNVPEDAGNEGAEDLRWVLKACFELDKRHCADGDAVRRFAESVMALREATPSLKKALRWWLEVDATPFEKLGRRPSGLLERLTDIAIGSPAVCAIRMFSKCKDYDPASQSTLAFEFAYAFARKMNTPASTLVIDSCYEGKSHEESHWERTLDYCINGNLQSVLDEYAHQIGFDKPARVLCDKVIGGNVSTFKGPSLYTMQSQYDVETLKSFRSKVGITQNGEKPLKMRTEFAAAFMDDEGGGSNSDRRDNLRRAFNSPFRPFVLASTSVGQEGLDFHAYCRRIVHWNLPSNPIDLEQREGRINRYESLALRQNVAKRNEFSFASPCEDAWDTLFRREEEASASEDWAGLAPHWGLGDYDEDLMVERRVYLRRLGREEIRYGDLIDTLVRYRAVLGMPRQEELLKVLSSELTEEEMRSLFINLCPFGRKRDA